MTSLIVQTGCPKASTNGCVIAASITCTEKSENLHGCANIYNFNYKM